MPRGGDGYVQGVGTHSQVSAAFCCKILRPNPRPNIGFASTVPNFQLQFQKLILLHLLMVQLKTHESEKNALGADDNFANRF